MEPRGLRRPLFSRLTQERLMVRVAAVRRKGARVSPGRIEARTARDPDCGERLQVRDEAAWPPRGPAEVARVERPLDQRRQRVAQPPDLR